MTLMDLLHMGPYQTGQQIPGQSGMDFQDGWMGSSPWEAPQPLPMRWRPGMAYPRTATNRSSRRGDFGIVRALEDGGYYGAPKYPAAPRLDAQETMGTGFSPLGMDGFGMSQPGRPFRSLSSLLDPYGGGY